MVDIVNGAKAPKFARLRKVGNLLNQYAHCWGESPSDRMYKWVNEYDLLRSSLSWEDWQEYCALEGYDPYHDAYDCLA